MSEDDIRDIWNGSSDASKSRMLKAALAPYKPDPLDAVSDWDELSSSTQRDLRKWWKDFETESNESPKGDLEEEIYYHEYWVDDKDRLINARINKHFEVGVNYLFREPSVRKWAQDGFEDPAPKDAEKYKDVIAGIEKSGGVVSYLIQNKDWIRIYGDSISVSTISPDQIERVARVMGGLVRDQKYPEDTNLSIDDRTTKKIHNVQTKELVDNPSVSALRECNSSLIAINKLIMETRRIQGK